MTDRDDTAYQKKYGAWAGFPQGHKPDFDCCCEAVVPNERGARGHQCRNKRGYGPGEAYCKTHDPAAVRARAAKSQADYNAKTNARRYEWYGKHFFKTLEEIANGHNDARGLAQEVIAKFKAGAR